MLKINPVRMRMEYVCDDCGKRYDYAYAVNHAMQVSITGRCMECENNHTHEGLELNDEVAKEIFKEAKEANNE